MGMTNAMSPIIKKVRFQDQECYCYPFGAGPNSMTMSNAIRCHVTLMKQLCHARLNLAREDKRARRRNGEGKTSQERAIYRNGDIYTLNTLTLRKVKWARQQVCLLKTDYRLYLRPRKLTLKTPKGLCRNDRTESRRTVSKR